MGWKQDLDPVIKEYLNSLLKEVQKYRDSYLKADDVQIAQLWVALAIIYRKVLSLESEINKIEDILNSKDIDIKKILEESLKKI